MSSSVVSPLKQEVVKYLYEWEINDFDLKFLHTGHHSPVFAAGEYKWRLYLHIPQKSPFIGIYLKPARAANVQVQCAFSILDHESERFKTVHSVEDFIGDTDIRGITEFIEKEILNDSKNNLLSNGKLKLLCEIAISSYEENQDNISDFEKFFNNKEFSDMQFVVGGKYVYAHKIILSNSSDVFAAMFKHQMKENTENMVVIEDIDYEVFAEMFRFIYTGKVNQTEIRKHAKNLYIAADKYVLKRLKAICLENLCENLSLDNALEYLEFADLYSADRLKRKAIDFIVSHVGDIEKIPGFVSRANLHNDVIEEVFHRFALLQRKVVP